MNLIIFDIDGTLVFSNKIDSWTFAQSYKEEFGLPFPSINWNDYPHVTDETIFETVFLKHFNRKPTAKEIANFQTRFVNHLEANRLKSPLDFKQVPNAAHTIHRLLNMDGYSVGIATGGWALPAKVKLRHIGIDPSNLYCGFADNNYTREAIIHEALNHAKQHLQHIERVVYIGDANWDVTTTRNMKIPFVGIRFRGDRDVLLRLGAKHVLTDYNDFDGFLKIVAEAEVPN